MPSFKNYTKVRRKPSRGKHQDELNPTSLSNQEDHNSFQSNIINMQGIIGNQAVMQMLRHSDIEQPKSKANQMQANTLKIQRMPTRSQAMTQAGLPSGKGGKVTRYLAVLTALDNLDSNLKNTTLAEDRDGILSQFGKLRELYDALNEDATIYLDRLARFDKKSKRAKYVQSLMPQLAAEKAQLVPIMLRMLDNPGGVYNIQPSLLTVVSSHQNKQEGKAVNIDKSDRTGTAGGGMNEAGFYDEGVFKAPEMHLTDDLMVGYNDDNVVEFENAAIDYGKTKGMTRNSATNEYWIAGHDLKLSGNDSLANREIAMSYLDRLLGAGMLVRTEKALEHDGINTKEGVIMENAGGTKMGEYVGENGKDSVKNNAVMKDLSKLQLLDLLALQIDRHTGNYMVKTDMNGTITGLKGFDHDMSFGRRGDWEKGHLKEIPGLAKYVDKELAQRIVDLDPAMLNWVLEGLIEPDAIAYTLERLDKLKTHLSDNMDKWLESDEWENAMNNDDFEDDKSYINKCDFKE